MDDNNRIRIKEAVEHAKSQGKKIKKQDLAMEVFPGTTQKSAVVCLNNLERKFTQRVTKVQVVTLSRELSVDANFLFDTPPMKYPDKKDNPIE